MAVETVQVQQYRCDGCGKAKVVGGDGEMPHGIHGSIKYIDAAGAVNVDFYACTRRCVSTAISNAVAVERVSLSISEPHVSQEHIGVVNSVTPEGGVVTDEMEQDRPRYKDSGTNVDVWADHKPVPE